MPASATTAKHYNNKKTTTNTTTSALEAYLRHKRTQRLLNFKPTPGKVMRDRALARGLRGG
jgi:hypothetical protein